MKLDLFTRGYLDAIIFTECHCDNPELEHKSSSDFSEELKAKIQSDCEKFQAENDLADYPLLNAGHDFWLTRNGHGAGFWENDFGTEEQCKNLTQSAHNFGNCDIYLGDDRKIYA